MEMLVGCAMISLKLVECFHFHFTLSEVCWILPDLTGFSLFAGWSYASLGDAQYAHVFRGRWNTLPENNSSGVNAVQIESFPSNVFIRVAWRRILIKIWLKGIPQLLFVTKEQLASVTKNFTMEKCLENVPGGGWDCWIFFFCLKLKLFFDGFMLLS